MPHPSSGLQLFNFLVLFALCIKEKRYWNEDIGDFYCCFASLDQKDLDNRIETLAFAFQEYRMHFSLFGAHYQEADKEKEN